mgnify:CR=1 FL=1
MRRIPAVLICLAPVLLWSQEPPPFKPGAYAASGSTFEASEQVVRPGASVLLR